MTMENNLLPHLTEPVERTVSGTVAIDDATAEQSFFIIIPFADDADE